MTATRSARLSSNQLRMWLYHELLPMDTTFQGPVSAHLHGSLRLSAIRAAAATVAARHEILRTRFPIVEGVPVQLIEPHHTVSVRLVDLSGLSTEDHDRAVAGVIAQISARPFDFAAAPAWRVVIARLAPAEHVLILVAHHMIVDLWSIGLVIGELCDGYRDAAEGKPHALPPVRLQQAALATRQENGPHTARQAWWGKRLSGVRAVALSSPRPRAIRPNLTTHVHETQLGERLSDDLRRTSRAEGVTLYVTALAAMACLVVDWCGQTEFVVISNTSGRQGRDAERLVGTPVEYLVVHVDASGDPTFRELLGRLGEAALDAFDHVIPLDEMFAAIDPGRVMRPSPLRQLGFSVLNAPRAQPALPGVSLRGRPPSPTRAGVSEGDLWWELHDTGGGPLGVRLQLSDQLFDAESAQLTVAALADLMDTAIRLPHLRVSDLKPTHRPERGDAADMPRPAPDNAAIELVRAVMARVLGRERLERTDNFFLMGGTPSDALKLADRLSLHCGTPLSVFDIELSPTVEGIASLLAGGRRRA